jgi:hypothetical protein
MKKKLYRFIFPQRDKYPDAVRPERARPSALLHAHLTSVTGFLPGRCLHRTKTPGWKTFWLYRMGI